MSRQSVKVRLTRLAQEYGAIALGTWCTLFALVLAGFATAIKLGVDGAGGEDQGGAATASILGSAYVATLLTKPLRIGATVVLTPVVARAVRRLRAGKASPALADQTARSDGEQAP